MKKAIAATGVLLLLTLVVVVLVSFRGGGAGPDPRPEVLRVGPGQASIAWRGSARAPGRLYYRPAGSEAAPWSAGSPPARLHQVLLRGLRPSTRYSYWFGRREARHSFRTAPLPVTPFSFLLTWGDPSRRLRALLASERPEFILALSPRAAAGPDTLGDARPSTPIFNTTGADSKLLRFAPRRRWALQWGGLRLLFTADGGLPAGALEPGPAHTTGVVVSANIEVSRVGSSALHATLVRHNRQHPGRPAAFVILLRASGQPVITGGVRYVPGSALRGNTASGATRVDVAEASVVATLLDRGHEVLLRQSAVSRRRTCKECRQLADRGAYEESVKAYVAFISTHQGHFQLDDAHLAVAEILDEKLFRFRQALTWYRALSRTHGHSTLAPLARQRIKYLEAHADHDYQPLARFQRVRHLELPRSQGTRAGRQRCRQQVRAILVEFPRCSLAPVMRYWLANQLRRDDPDGAVTAYRRLMADFPGDHRAAEAPLEIGETYYQARRYSEAARAFQAALTTRPGRASEISPHLERALRNVWRGRGALVAGAVLLLLLALGLLLPPRGIPRQLWARGVKGWLPLASLTLLAGWFMSDKFTSAGELLGLALSTSAAAALGHPISAGLAAKLLGPRGGARPGRTRLLLRGMLGTLLGLLLLGAVSYLALYLLNEHYLTVIKL